MGPNAMRALIRATADAAAANAVACDRTAQATPEDRDGLAGRREGHVEAAEALRGQAAALRPATTRAAAEAVQRDAAGAARFTSRTGDARLRRDLAAVGHTGLTVVSARRAARARARSAEYSMRPRVFKRAPEDAFPKPRVRIITGATSGFRTEDDPICCDKLDVANFPFIQNEVHSGRHPQVVQRVIHDAAFQEVLHTVKRRLADSIDQLAVPDYVPTITVRDPTDERRVAVITVCISSERGQYRAIAVGFALRHTLQAEGFRTAFTMRGGRNPCQCGECSDRDVLEHVSPSTRGRLERIWGALSPLWPPRVPVTEEEERDEQEPELDELYARQGAEPLPQRRERKLKPNPRGAQAVAKKRRRYRLRLRSRATVRRERDDEAEPAPKRRRRFREHSPREEEAGDADPAARSEEEGQATPAPSAASEE